jgi:hypothetical protein
MGGRLAGIIGCTEGQVYTLTIGLVLALTMATLGLPPTLQPLPVGVRLDEASVKIRAGGPSDDEEDVDTARHLVEPDVVRGDEQRGQGPETLDLLALLLRRGARGDRWCTDRIGPARRRGRYGGGVGHERGVYRRNAGPT